MIGTQPQNDLRNLPELRRGDAIGYVELASGLVRARKFSEAERVLAEAGKWARADSRVAAAYARIAGLCRNWKQAAERWHEYCKRFPTDVAGIEGQIYALLNMGRIEDAESRLAEVMRSGGIDWRVRRLNAAIAIRKQDWNEAFSLLSGLVNLRPPTDIESDVGEALQLWRLAREAGNPSALAVQLPSTLAERVRRIGSFASSKSPRSVRDLMMNFESLGDHCEFGLVQRHFGAEPLGLLRWSAISPQNLAAAVLSKFEGIGEPHNTHLAVNEEGEYFGLDPRWFHMHSFIREGTLPAPDVHRRICAHLKFLRQKLLEDLTEGDKVFVYRKHGSPIRLYEVTELREAFRLSFPMATLMFVKQASEERRVSAGQVEALDDKTLVGYVSGFSDAGAKSISFASWKQVCRAALRLCAGKRAPPSPPIDINEGV